VLRKQEIETDLKTVKSEVKRLERELLDTDRKIMKLEIRNDELMEEISREGNITFELETRIENLTNAIVENPSSVLDILSSDICLRAHL
jgi:peptidoglycan hydrolase CwlO-like protein